jgi:hypothetical protein
MDSTSKRGSGKCLSDSHHLEIIAKLQRPNPPVSELLRENMALLRVLFKTVEST